MQVEATKAIRFLLDMIHVTRHTSHVTRLRFLLYVICSGAPAGDVAATEAYGEEVGGQCHV